MTASLNKLLLDNIHTKEELDILIAEITQLLASQYNTGHSFESLLLSGISATTASFIEKNIKNKDKDKLVKGLTELSNVLKNIKVIRLTLGFELTNESIVNIHQWFISNMKDLYVLDIHIDPKILGGVVIEYEGRFGDYSLRKKVDQYLKDHKKELLMQITHS